MACGKSAATSQRRSSPARRPMYATSSYASSITPSRCLQLILSSTPGLSMLSFATCKIFISSIPGSCLFFYSLSLPLPPSKFNPGFCRMVLESRMKDWGAETQVGDIFTSFWRTEIERLYSRYVQGLDGALELYYKLMEENSQFKEFVTVRLSHTTHLRLCLFASLPFACRMSSNKLIKILHHF